jgi:hypothetical protein
MRKMRNVKISGDLRSLNLVAYSLKGVTLETGVLGISHMQDVRQGYREEECG